MNSNELPTDEYAAAYAPYISTLNNIDLIEELEISIYDFIRFVQHIPMDKHNYRYAEGKWTIKDIIQHLADAERVFSYRALRFSRNDQTPLPGFDENDYAKDADGEKRPLQELLTEFTTIRQGTLELFKSLSDEKLKRKGIASNNEVSVRALGFIIIGHLKHHKQVFQERYLNQ